MASVNKTRQMELGMGALAERMAGVGSDPIQDKIWTDWMGSPGSFGARADHWDFLAEKLGLAMARAGWSKIDAPAMEAFKAWARPKRGNKATSFDEGRFIRIALAKGWRAGGESAEACAWARVMDESRLAYLKSPGIKSSKKERESALDPRIDLGLPTKPAHEWTRIAAAEPSAAEYLFSDALRAYVKQPWSKEPAGSEDDYARAMGVAAFMDQAKLDRALFNVLAGWPGDAPETRVARARVAAALGSLGADWEATTPMREGRVDGAARRIVNASNPWAAAAAIEAMGPEKFWSQTLGVFKDYFEGQNPLATRLIEAARWVSSMDPGDLRCARYLLGRACSDLTDIDNAGKIAEALDLLGPMAKVSEMSAWDFEGFAGKNRSGGLNGPIEARFWAGTRMPMLREMERHGKQSPLGAFIAAMTRHGAAAPWDDMPENSLTPAAQAAVEGWTLSAGVAASAPSGQGPKRM